MTGRAPQEKIAALTAEVMTRLAHELSPHLFEALVAIIKKRNKELVFNLILEQGSKSCTDLSQLCFHLFFTVTAAAPNETGINHTHQLGVARIARPLQYTTGDELNVSVV